jgi:hypothetical protein
MSIELGGREFEGPYPLTIWDPPKKPAVYAILKKPDPINKPKSYKLLFIDQSKNLSERGFYKTHPKYDCWVKESITRSNLYVAFYVMPISMPPERDSVVNLLVEKYKPVCNA